MYSSLVPRLEMWLAVVFTIAIDKSVLRAFIYQIERENILQTYIQVVYTYVHFSRPCRCKSDFITWHSIVMVRAVTMHRTIVEMAFQSIVFCCYQHVLLICVNATMS